MVDELARISLERDLRAAAAVKPPGYDQATPITRRAWNLKAEEARAKVDADLARSKAPAAPQRPANYATLSPMEKRVVDLENKRKSGR